MSGSSGSSWDAPLSPSPMPHFHVGELLKDCPTENVAVGYLHKIWVWSDVQSVGTISAEEFERLGLMLLGIMLDDKEWSTTDTTEILRQSFSQGCNRCGEMGKAYFYRSFFNLVESKSEHPSAIFHGLWKMAEVNPSNERLDQLIHVSWCLSRLQSVIRAWLGKRAAASNQAAAKIANQAALIINSAIKKSFPSLHAHLALLVIQSATCSTIEAANNAGKWLTKEVGSCCVRCAAAAAASAALSAIAADQAAGNARAARVAKVQAVSAAHAASRASFMIVKKARGIVARGKRSRKMNMENRKLKRRAKKHSGYADMIVGNLAVDRIPERNRVEQRPAKSPPAPETRAAPLEQQHIALAYTDVDEGVKMGFDAKLYQNMLGKQGVQQQKQNVDELKRQLKFQESLRPERPSTLNSPQPNNRQNTMELGSLDYHFAEGSSKAQKVIRTGADVYWRLERDAPSVRRHLQCKQADKFLAEAKVKAVQASAQGTQQAAQAVVAEKARNQANLVTRLGRSMKLKPPVSPKTPLYVQRCVAARSITPSPRSEILRRPCTPDFEETSGIAEETSGTLLLDAAFATSSLADAGEVLPAASESIEDDTNSGALLLDAAFASVSSEIPKNITETHREAKKASQKRETTSLVLTLPDQKKQYLVQSNNAFMNNSAPVAFDSVESLGAWSLNTCSFEQHSMLKDRNSSRFSAHNRQRRTIITQAHAVATTPSQTLAATLTSNLSRTRPVSYEFGVAKARSRIRAVKQQQRAQLWPPPISKPPPVLLVGGPNSGYKSWQARNIGLSDYSEETINTQLQQQWLRNRPVSPRGAVSPRCR